MNPHLPRRLAIRGATAAFAALVAAGGMAVAASGANASAGQPAANPVTNPYSPAYQHAYRHGVVPTIAQNLKMQHWKQQHPGAAAASANDLNYGGGIDGIGVTTGAEKVYIVFYGSQWGTQSTNSNGDVTLSGDPSGLAPYYQEFIKGLGTGGELWSGVMTQYCEGVPVGTQICPAGNTSHVAYPTGGALAGVWVDESTASPAAASGHQLGVEAVNAAGHFGNTTAASNRDAQYVIVSPHGTNPDNYQTQGFCAWHDYNGDSTLSGGAVSSSFGDISFTNAPYVPDAGASCGQNFVNSNGPLDGVSIVFGHEYAETITDQNPAGGYTDSSGEENGDKCAWITPGTAGGSFDLSTGHGTFAVQTTWGNDGNNNNGTCQASHAIVGNGGGGNTISVTNPGSQTGTVGTAVSLQIHASDSASGQTLTYSASGLPAGLSINSSSGLISGTPTTAATSSVTVTAKDTTNASGSASFSWTINPSGGGGCTNHTQLLGNPGFETGSASPWTSTAGVINANGAGETSHGGSWYAWLDGYGTTHTDTLAQTVTVPAGCTATTFSFWLHIDTSETTTTTAFDTLKVQVLSGSTVLATLATFSNLNHITGYAQHSYSLGSFAGQTITLKFTGSEDASLQTSFVVDDTAANPN
ncbi:MAG TPA: putative Ig domain-containing protein [Streptosporangiaceae bacterium]|nr:putative Ig domain-containing protein [Streptosporangiaceae bacterium]